MAPRGGGALRLILNSYATSVPESAEKSFSKAEGRAPSYSELVQRLTLITEGIDFLLGHPDLKPSDRELGLFELRQTVLFGKKTDKNTVRQQAHGVRNLNRGTGRHEKTLQRARQRLRKLGFMRTLMEPGDRHGNTYAPDFEFISQAVERMRTPEQIAPPSPGTNCSPHQSYPSGSNSQSAAQLACEPARSVSALQQEQETYHRKPAPWKSVTIEDHEVEQMRTELAAISKAYPRSNFGALTRRTAHDVMAAAKLARADATPADVSAFLAEKFRDRRPFPYERGIQTFAGMFTMVAEDFGGWVVGQAKINPLRDLPVNPGAPTATPVAERLEEKIPTSESAQVAKDQSGKRQSSSICPHCSNRGFHLDTGTETVSATEFRTVAAFACTCSKGRSIGYSRLAAIEQREAERYGSGWLPAHRCS